MERVIPENFCTIPQATSWNSEGEGFSRLEFHRHWKLFRPAIPRALEGRLGRGAGCLSILEFLKVREGGRILMVLFSEITQFIYLFINMM